MRFATGPFTPDMNDGNHVFVFGSNLAARHGKGAALIAKQHWGASWRRNKGPFSHSYAIPTKDFKLNTLSMPTIQFHVKDFIEHAKEHTEITFLVTAIGTGLAGYNHKQIAPMFKDAPDNCVLPREWEQILQPKATP